MLTVKFWICFRHGNIATRQLNKPAPRTWLTDGSWRSPQALWELSDRLLILEIGRFLMISTIIIRNEIHNPDWSWLVILCAFQSTIWGTLLQPTVLHVTKHSILHCFTPFPSVFRLLSTELVSRWPHFLENTSFTNSASKNYKTCHHLESGLVLPIPITWDSMCITGVLDVPWQCCVSEITVL